MNVLPYEEKLRVIDGLCNGMSLRAATRVFGVHRTTIMKLLVRVGKRCDDIMRVTMRDLDLEQLQIDELWTFCQKKQGKLTPTEKQNLFIGDQYCVFAIDRDTKLVPAWVLGKRDLPTAARLVGNLKNTLNGCKPQISTDNFAAYPRVVEMIFGPDVDFATVTKHFDTVASGPGRYAPPKVSRVTKEIKSGNPDERMISTSHVERCNLTIRTFQRRFTRLALGFSKKWENLYAACALHFAYYNFVWVPRATRCTPAQAAGIVPNVWTIKDLVGEC